MPNVLGLNEAPLNTSVKAKAINNVLLLNPGGPGIMMRGLMRERPTQYGFCWPSIDLVLTSGLLNEKGFHLSYIDASLDKLSALDVSEKIKRENVQAIVALYSHFYHENDIQFLRTIKEQNPSLKIIILPNLQHVLKPEKAPRFLKEQEFLDAIVLSLTNNDLNKYLKADFSSPLVNMCYKLDGQIIVGRKEGDGKNGYVLPVPRHDLFKNKKYFLPQSRSLYVTTTCMQFGCPYQCDFCIDKDVYAKSFCRAPENMLAEFEYIAAQGIREVYLRDLTFGLSREHALKFCHLLAERKLPLRWVCTTRVDTVDEELLTAMKKAGCMAIEFGIESGIDKTKDIHKKGTKNEQAKKTFSICQRLGIETVMFVILGFPEENLEDINRSIQFVFDLKGDFLALNLANLLPETSFEAKNLEYKSDKEKGDYLDSYSFDKQNFAHPTIGEEEMRGIFRKTLRDFYLRPTYIIKRLLKMRSWPALWRVMHIGFNVIRVSLIQPPKKTT